MNPPDSHVGFFLTVHLKNSIWSFEKPFIFFSPSWSEFAFLSQKEGSTNPEMSGFFGGTNEKYAGFE